ncbi:MAG: polyprenyl synthetase family protein [Arcanobacterium sp.]|nr:polyprenyl synthetase family protein [Arcanobacterium sp.]
MTERISAFRKSLKACLENQINPDIVFPVMKNIDFFQQFITHVTEPLGAGKHTRALLLSAGWELAANAHGAPMAGKQEKLPVFAGAAIELYQLSALVHDDVIDESPTRRGFPAAYINYQKQHREKNLIGNDLEYGIKSAILLGDYLLSLATLTFESAEHLDVPSFQRARRLFSQMSAEVAFGQYLDNRNDHTPFSADVEAQISNALSVLYHKAARYSVDLPLQIGACLNGADDELLRKIHEIAVPLGEAFQLRDDEIGIFSPSELTGKPEAGDITEAKRTVLLALTRSLATPAQLTHLESLLGKALSPTEVDEIREIITSSGALAKQEKMILARESECARRYENLGISSEIFEYCFNLLSSRKF